MNGLSASTNRARLLLVDDEPNLLQAMQASLLLCGYENIDLLEGGVQVLQTLEQSSYDALILDINMPGQDGLELLPQICSQHPELPVIIVTGANEIRTAVQSIRAGAFDYLVKPVSAQRLEVVIKRALEFYALQKENRRLNHELVQNLSELPAPFKEVITSNPKMLQLLNYAQVVAQSANPVLITGQTGVGKELFARGIHRASARSGEFVAVNTAGLDDHLFSDTLFGHVKGAYTGADRTRPGLIEKAAGGTLFLDEIGDLSASSQVKLLRLLQDGEYYPLGSTTARRLDARLLFATNSDPATLQHGKGFRSDLYYRISVHEINIPPLCERFCDLPALCAYLVERSAQELGVRPPLIQQQLYPLLQTYSFPGNIRELRGIIADAVSRSKGVLELEPVKNTLKARMNNSFEDSGTASSANISACNSVSNLADLPHVDSSANAIVFSGPLPELKEMTNALFNEAMLRSKNNQTQAARLLGISQQAVSKHFKSCARPL